MNVNEITESSAEGPTRLGIHSVEGFGKTTLAAYFPRPVFLAPEQFAPRDLPFRPKRFPTVTKWEHAFEAITSLTDDKHDRETLVIDTIDWLEPLIHRYICARDSGRKSELNKAGHELISIEDYGFGKGYVAASEEFRKLISALDLLQYKRGMHIVALMHSSVQKFDNPSGQSFDRWQPKMHYRISRITVEWCENVIFGHFEVLAGKLEERDKKAKGVHTGRRLIGTQQNALYDAKNRMNLPMIMELTEPEEMIPCLLGEHLAGAVTPTSQTREPAPSKLKPPEEKREPAPVAKPEPKREEPKAQETVVEQPPMRTQPLPPGYEEPKTDAKLQAPPSKAESIEVDAAQRDLLKRLYGAQQLAKDFNPAYGATVDGWIEQAKGNAVKLNKIIERVTRDTTIEQTT